MFEEPHKVIPYQIDGIVKEWQMKYQKTVQALDRIHYLIGKQEFLIKGHRKQLQPVAPCEIQEIS